MTGRFASSSLMFGNFVTGLSIMSPAAMLGDLATAFDVSVYQASLLVTFGAAVLGIGSPLMTWLTSRIDRRRLLAGAMLCVATCEALGSIAPDYASMLALRLLMLATVVVFTPVAVGAAAMVAPESRRPETIVYVFLGWSLAFAFGMPLMTYATAHFGWRETLGGIGLLALLAMTMIVVCLPKGLIGAPVRLNTWIALSRDRLIILLLLITVLQVSGQFCVFPYIGLLLDRLTRAGPETIGIAFGLFGIFGLLGNLFAVKIIERIGPFWTSGGFLMSLLLGSIVWSIGAEIVSTWVLLLGAAVWGFGFAATNSIQQTRLVAAVPMYASASVALNTSALYTGQALGSGLGGQFLVRNQLHASGIAGITFTAAAIGVLLLTRRRRPLSIVA